MLYAACPSAAERACCCDSRQSRRNLLIRKTRREIANAIKDFDHVMNNRMTLLQADTAHKGSILEKYITFEGCPWMLRR
jgi:hypothetical protein